MSKKAWRLEPRKIQTVPLKDTAVTVPVVLINRSNVIFLYCKQKAVFVMWLTNSFVIILKLNITF